MHESLSKGALPCEIVVNSKVKVRTHKKKEHSSWCDLCDVVMRETINLKLHRSWDHEGRENKCRPCGKVVMAGTKLELHKMQTHKNLFKWAQPCGPHGIVSRNRRSMELHATRVHKGRSIKCRLCGSWRG